MEFKNTLMKYLRAHRAVLCSAAGLFLFSLFLNWTARSFAAFGPWYNARVYPILPATLGRLLSPLPFSLFEWLTVLALLSVCGFVLFCAAALWRRRGRQLIRRALARAVPAVLCLAAALFFLQTLTCFLNYSRTDFSADLGVITYPATDEELTELCRRLIADLDEEIAQYGTGAPHVTASGGSGSGSASGAPNRTGTGSDAPGGTGGGSDAPSGTGTGSSGQPGGSTDSSPAPAPLLFSEEGTLLLDNIDVRQEAKKAMEKLGGKYPALSGYYPNPKPIFFSRAMSTVNLTGIFSPYTTEANYNRDVTPYVIPYTICHELAHVKGFIKENEAGFIAYLACSNSDSPQLRYSGALNALSYSLNALYRSVSTEEYQEVLRTVPPQALKDLQTNQAYWQEFNQGVRGAISETARAANDSYLRANAQTDGTKSYGRMVDLLLAYYKIGSKNL